MPAYVFLSVTVSELSGTKPGYAINQSINHLFNQPINIMLKPKMHSEIAIARPIYTA